MFVAKHLRRSIIEADLKLGEVLSEEKIAAALDVSRTPVREALGLLQLQGLIEIVPQKGSYVFLPSSQDIAMLAEHRAMLEQEAVRLAFERGRESMLRDMKRAVVSMEKARAKTDAIGYARSDDLFHLAAFAHSGNQYLQDAYNAVSGRIAALRSHLAAPLKAFAGRSFIEHKTIVRAIEAQDLKTALDVIRNHIAQMERDYIGAIDSGLFEVPRSRPRLKGPRPRARESSHVATKVAS